MIVFDRLMKNRYFLISKLTTYQNFDKIMKICMTFMQMFLIRKCRNKLLLKFCYLHAKKILHFFLSFNSFWISSIISSLDVYIKYIVFDASRHDMISISFKAKIIDSIKNFELAMRQQTFCLSKSRIFVNVIYFYFIRIFEKEIINCDIFIDEKLLFDFLIHRFFQLWRFREVDSKFEIISLKIKNISFHVDNKNNIVWIYEFNQKQFEKCQVVIITNIKESRFVVLISMKYVRRLKKKSVEYNVYEIYRSMWTLHLCSSFFFDYASFMILNAQIEKKLQIMRNYFKDIRFKWYNSNKFLYRWTKLNVKIAKSIISLKLYTMFFAFKIMISQYLNSIMNLDVKCWIWFRKYIKSSSTFSTILA